MSRNLCVYCSSSSAIAPEHVNAARELGSAMVAGGWNLVYGGTTAGLMGVLADAVMAAGGRAVGVIPRHISQRGIAHQGLTELIVTEDMRERKAAMEHRADAFLALPGGFGTLEEIFEVLTLKQLQLHVRPVAFVNTRGFYEPLRSFLDHLIAEQFAKPESVGLYHIAESPHAALEYLEDYSPAPAASKWF